MNDGDFLFCDAGRHNNDDKIKIHDALIWLLQDLSKYPRTVYMYIRDSQTTYVNALMLQAGDSRPNVNPTVKLHVFSTATLQTQVLEPPQEFSRMWARAVLL